MRTIIIGDVHGCYNALCALLKKVQYDSLDDKLILVGDYIDRGPQIRETVDFVMELKASAPYRVTLLRGNHEQMLLDVGSRIGKSRYWRNNTRDNSRLLMYYAEIKSWYRNGGRDTETQLLREDNYKKYLSFFESLPIEYFSDYDDRFYVTHAAALKGRQIDDDNMKLWNREFSLYKEAPLAICGHTPLERVIWTNGSELRKYEEGGLYQLPKNGNLCLDTGCVFGYSLTAMVVKENEFYLVSARQ